jgi:hypothetical protein
VVEEPKHALAGSINRRINLFSHMAKHSAGAVRPPRRVSSVLGANAEDNKYQLQTDDDATAVNV